MKSRRSFLKFDLGKSEDNNESKNAEETVKMLTPDGILVEIKRSLTANPVNKKRASNKEILKWVNKKPC
jgi:hypothetical protein